MTRCIFHRLQFFLGYFDKKRNQVVNNPWFIVKRYVCSWFFLDFVSIFPFDLARGNADLRKLRVLKIMRLIKLVKLNRLVRMANKSSIRSQCALYATIGREQLSRKLTA